MFSDKLEFGLKALGTAVALGGLLLTGIQYTRNQAVEAAKPFLEKKLKWCEEAVELSSFIATAEPGNKVVAAKALRFKQLYWGAMSMVENETITQAMIAFGQKLDAKEPASSLQTGSINLAHACRQEMADSWSPIWRRP
jgi:hypothetical protein